MREPLELGDRQGERRRRERASQLGDPQREQVHGRDLAGERLGRRHADLQPGPRVENAVGLARGLRSHDVRQRQHGGAATTRGAHRGERVGGLPGLRDPDHQIVGPHDGVAVAVLGRDVDLDREPGPLLDRVAPDQPGVIGGPAGDDHDPPDAPQELVVDRPEVAEVDPVGPGGALAERLGDRVGLLVDLLEHERLIALLLGRLGVPVDLHDLALQRLAVGGLELDALGPQHDDLVVAHVLDLARLAQEGRDRRADELLAVAAADDQRALLAGAHEHAGRVGAHGHERVVAAQAPVGLAHGGGQVPVVAARDQVGDHLGVGLGGEHRARVDELLLELDVVLDDPVDDDVDAIRRCRSAGARSPR